MHWRRQGRRWRESNTPTPTSAPLARARGRKPNVSFRMGRAERHVGGVGAREAASRKPDENPHEKQERGARRVRVARACDEEDFRDRVTGEGMGCGREDNLVPGSPGRGGFGKWGRLFGDVSVRRQMVSVWVNEDVLCGPTCAALSTGGGRRALHRKGRTERPRAARSTPAPKLSPKRPRDTQGGRGKRRREAERGSLGVSMGILPGGSR